MLLCDYIHFNQQVPGEYLWWLNILGLQYWTQSNHIDRMNVTTVNVTTAFGGTAMKLK